MSEEPKHICTCGDCAVAPFVDRCKYEEQVERLKKENARLRADLSEVQQHAWERDRDD